MPFTLSRPMYKLGVFIARSWMAYNIAIISVLDESLPLLACAHVQADLSSVLPGFYTRSTPARRYYLRFSAITLKTRYCFLNLRSESIFDAKQESQLLQSLHVRLGTGRLKIISLSR